MFLITLVFDIQIRLVLNLCPSSCFNSLNLGFQTNFALLSAAIDSIGIETRVCVQNLPLFSIYNNLSKKYLKISSMHLWEGEDMIVIKISEMTPLKKAFYKWWQWKASASQSKLLLVPLCRRPLNSISPPSVYLLAEIRAHTSTVV